MFDLRDPDLLAAVAATREGVQDHLRNQAQLLAALRELLPDDTDPEAFVTLQAAERRGLLAMVADSQTPKLDDAAIQAWDVYGLGASKPRLALLGAEVYDERESDDCA